MRCNTQPCPAEWRIGEWSACDCGQWNEKDYQTREVKCEQELSTDLLLHVNEGACLEEMPEKRQVCKCTPRRPEKYKHHKHRKHDEAETPSQETDSIQQNRQQRHRGIGNNRQLLTLIANTTLSRRAHVHVADNKKAGVWLASDWNEQV